MRCRHTTYTALWTENAAQLHTTRMCHRSPCKHTWMHFRQIGWVPTAHVTRRLHTTQLSSIVRGHCNGIVMQLDSLNNILSPPQQVTSFCHRRNKSHPCVQNDLFGGWLVHTHMHMSVSRSARFQHITPTSATVVVLLAKRTPHIHTDGPNAMHCKWPPIKC